MKLRTSGCDVREGGAPGGDRLHVLEGLADRRACLVPGARAAAARMFGAAVVAALVAGAAAARPPANLCPFKECRTQVI